MRPCKRLSFGKPRKLFIETLIRKTIHRSRSFRLKRHHTGTPSSHIHVLPQVSLDCPTKIKFRTGARPRRLPNIIEERGSHAPLPSLCFKITYLPTMPPLKRKKVHYKAGNPQRPQVNTNRTSEEPLRMEGCHKKSHERNLQNHLHHPRRLQRE